MAKKGGKSKGFISQGLHRNVSKTISKSLRKDYLSSGERALNQRLAWAKGKNVVVTIENPNKHETNRRYVRVNAKDIWNSSKTR